MSEVENIQVAVFHGNALVAAGLRAALATAETFDIIEPRTTAAFPNVAVMITDYESGMRVLETSDPAPARVLIVTDDDSEVSIKRALERGARGYLPLSASMESVARAVQLIHGGATAIDPAALARVAVSLSSPALTGREIEVLRLMMRGLPNKAIAFNLRRTVGTAKSHVKSILAKLDVASRVEAVAVARRRGLVQD